MRVVLTDTFDLRMRLLRDPRAKARVNVAVQRMEEGNYGDWKSLGDGLLETRVHYGPGYRIYHTLRGGELVVVLLCGSKQTQPRDIELARKLARQL